MKKLIWIILLLNVNKISGQEIIRLDGIPDLFNDQDSTQVYDFNPLHVGNIWQYYLSDFDEPIYVSTRIEKDSLINNTRYFKRIDWRFEFNPTENNFISWVRNDSTNGASYMLDFEDLDEDGDSLEEFLVDNFQSSEPFIYNSYKYSYKNWNDGPIPAMFEETFWGIIWGDTVLVRLVSYGAFLSEFIADKYGLVGFTDESPLVPLSGAVIDGKNYGSIVNVSDIYTQIPTEIVLGNNYPNPFNLFTRIIYSVPIRSQVKLAVYDILGNQIRVLLDEVINQGIHEIIFNGEGLASGIYIYVMFSNNHLFSKQMLLLK